MQYTIDWVREQVARLKASGAGNPRVHPNGFIQVDLAEVEAGWHASHKRGHSGASLRLHIWNPPDHELPHQGTVNEIHDHVFDMRSNVIKGQLLQCLYCFRVGMQPTLECTHELYRAIYNKSADSRLEPLGVRGTLVNHRRLPVKAGESYTQPAFTLHDSVARGCVVTVMEKLKVHEGDASVICDIGKPPDNSFDRASAAPAEYLWSAIEAAIA